MTSRKPRLVARAADAAERSIGDYRDLVENLNEGVYRSTPDGKLLLANRALARILGYESVEELLDRDIARDIYLDARDREDNLRRVIQDGSVFHYVLRLRKKNGEVVLAEETSRTVCDAQGRIQYFEGIIEDVTERTAAAQDARYFRDLFQAATENVSDGVIHLALDGSIQYVNSVIERNARVKREEILGKHFSVVWPDPPLLVHERHRTWTDAFQTAVETRSSVQLNNFPIRYRNPNRNPNRNSDTAFLLKLVPQIVNGQLRGMTVFVEYFTEQLRLQRQVLQSEARYRSLVENATDAIWTVDVEGRFVFINRSFEVVCGRSFADLKAKRFWESGVIAPEHVDLVRFQFEHKLDGAPESNYEVEFVHSSGERIPVEITSKLLYVEGHLSGVMGIGRDIRQRKALQKELLATKNHLQSIFDNALDAIIATDDQGSIVAWNKGAETIFGMGRDDMIGQPIGRLFPAEQYFQMYRARRSLQAGGAVSDLELTWTTGDREVYLNISVSPIRDERGAVRGMSAIARDITERKKLEVTLQRLVITDHLTETYNRYYFDQTLEKELTRSRRYGSALSLLLIDIDGFKEINDRYGHLMGDRVLKESASLLKCCIRNSDTLVRYGGDEFLVLLPETDRSKIRYVVRRIEEKLQHWNQGRNGLKRPLRFSIGSATCSRGADFEKALRRADRLMYQSKNRSRLDRKQA